MSNKITYKKQGDGRDSWRIEEPNGQIYMVYEDPNISELVKQFKKLSKDEIKIIKQLLT